MRAVPFLTVGLAALGTLSAAVLSCAPSTEPADTDAAVVVDLSLDRRDLAGVDQRQAPLDLATTCDLGAEPGERLFVTATTTDGKPWAALRTGGSWGAVAVGGTGFAAFVASHAGGRPIAIGRQSDDALVSSIHDPCGVGFATPSALFSLALTAERPAAVGGATVELVFRGSLSGDQRLFHSRFDGAWQPATTLGNFLSTLPPVALRTGSEVRAIFTGTDGNIYDGLVDGAGGTATTVAIAGADRGPAAATTAAGTFVVWKHGDTNLMWSTRAGGAAYATPKQLCDGLSSCLIASDLAPALTAQADGSVLAAWVGKGDGLVYTSRLAAAASMWTTPVAAGAEATSLVPALAPGLSGVDVELVYVRSSDAAGRHVRISGGVPMAPVSLPAGALGSAPALVTITP